MCASKWVLSRPLKSHIDAHISHLTDRPTTDRPTDDRPTADGGPIGRCLDPNRYAGPVEVQADPGQRVSWARRPRHPMLALRMAAIALVGALAVNASVALIGHQHWRRDSGDITTRFHPRRISAVESGLRRDGVRVSRDVHQLLAVLLTAWESRPDLQASFSTPNGDPAIAGLLDWAWGLPDAFSTAIVPHLGAILGKYCAAQASTANVVSAPEVRVVPRCAGRQQCRRRNQCLRS